MPSTAPHIICESANTIGFRFNIMGSIKGRATNHITKNIASAESAPTTAPTIGVERRRPKIAANTRASTTEFIMCPIMPRTTGMRENATGIAIVCRSRTMVAAIKIGADQNPTPNNPSYTISNIAITILATRPAISSFLFIVIIYLNKKVLIAGLVASIVMAMLEMVYEGLFGVGFWSAPIFIAATIVRDLQTIAIPVAFSLIPVVLGMMGHMMNSVVLALVFAAIFGRLLSTLMVGAVVGALYALAIFFVMWFVALPFIDPIMLNLNPIVFALSHMMWGAVLGIMISRRAN